MDMINIALEKPDYVDNLSYLSTMLKGKLSKNHLSIPSAVGEGYIWAEKTPSGMSVMVTETIMKESFSFIQLPANYPYFVLQFNEITPLVATTSTTTTRRLNRQDFNIVQSSVVLNDSSKPVSYSFPSNVKLRSVKFIFSGDHLKNLLGEEVTREMLDESFPSIAKNAKGDPIDTVYRVTLDDLLMETIDHPLRMNFIQNRVMLLLEKFIVKLYQRKHHVPKAKSNDDEISRLMKVEGLLVRDFSVAPPTIGELSKISAMSPTKLKNDFKNVYGLPIYEYYQKNRMLKAKSLLLEGKYSIKEVGMKVGYSNLSHFANTFKKEFGILPSELTFRDGMLVYNA
jgi:AraC-like DNA-binding protein